MGFRPAKMQRSITRQRTSDAKGAIASAGGNKEELLWNFLPGPQTLAADSDAFEVLYGGAAGGAKTAWLLTMALRKQRNSIIFRRIYPNLKEVIFKSQEILGPIPGAGYNGQDKIWRGIPGNKTLEFGAVQFEGSKYNYRGRPHDFKGFDELTELLESQYEFLIGWTRTHVKGQRCRVGATCNPPSAKEGIWVRKRWGPWIDPRYKGKRALPGELRWFIQVPVMVDGVPMDEQECLDLMPPGSLILRKKIILSEGGGVSQMYEVEVPAPDPIPFQDGDRLELLEPSSRTFIPARLEDNPFIDSSYKRTLMALPEPLRSQLLYGDFSIEIESSDEWQLIPTRWVRMAQERWQPHPPTGQSAIGVDVARGGQDNTVIASRHYTWVSPLGVKPGTSVPSGKDSAIAVRGHTLANDVDVFVDGVGLGASCYDFLIDFGVNAWFCNGGMRSDRKSRKGDLVFADKNAEWAWNLREIFDPDNGYLPAIPPDDAELEEELTVPRWERRGGKIYVESREELMKADRLGRSPDKFSAVKLAFSEFRE